MDTRSELYDEDLPTAPSVLEILLSASPFPSTRPKRSASCPPKLNEVSLEDLATQLGDMSIVLPYSDPIDVSVDIKQQADEQNRGGITVENAQTLLDPEACLFIANLPIHISDREIQMALTQFMSKGSEVFVKVNRTRSGLPFAHVQYLDTSTAKEMLEAKNLQLLWNRQLRIEQACATRFLYVGYRDEATARPTGSQMRDLFSNFEIESVRESTAEEMEDSRLDNCVVVHFAKWGECGEAFRTLRNDPTYWMKGPKKSHLAPPNSVPLQQGPRQAPPQMSLPTDPMPIIDWTGGFTRMMPYFFPIFQPFPPLNSQPLSPERPVKRRKRHDHVMDALPPPCFAPQW